MRPDPHELALYGGPATIADGPPPWPLPDEEVRQALEAAYADGSWGRYHGLYCERFAAALAAMHSTQFVALCCTGTVAVELALRGVSVEPGDEVILAGYDFPGNFRAVEAVGATPVLADIDPKNWSFDPGQLEAARSVRTRAVIVSHLHGGLVPMGQVMDCARQFDIAVVEDACQVPGATVEDRPAGSWGDVGVLSFGGSKLLTAGRGGALLIRDAQVNQRIKIFSQRGNDAFALSELQAAVLLPQLAKLEERNRRRAENVARLLDKTENLPALRPLVNRTSGSPSYYKLAWHYEPEGDAATRGEFLAAIRAEGVAMDAGFRGFARRSENRCRRTGPLTNCARAAEATVLLHHPVLLAEPETIEQVAAALHTVFNGLTRR